MYKLLILAILSLAIISCSAKDYPIDDGLVNGKPSWYWSPGYEGKLGGVGEAGFNVYGVSEQRKLATSRAIEDIARQKGLTVSSSQAVSHSAASDGTASVNIESYSVHTVEGMTISARVRQVWQDPSTDRIIVWATEE
ncbi:MAG: hypothetical protein LBV09_02375 [Deferribacteraceae bacterium]|jgi:hypothetical protein|nr:hypothetical protein [Deferribacteraceae bacterium]